MRPPFLARRAGLLACVLLLLSAPAARLHAQADGVRTTAQGVQVDFQETDLRLVLTALAEAGGLNVAFSDLPQKRITLRLTQPISREAVLPLLRSIAQSNGLRIREEAGYLRVESAEAGGGQLTSGADEGQQGGGVRLFVYRLRHAKAERLAATLQSLYGGRGGPAGMGTRRRTLSEDLRADRIPPARGDEADRVARDTSRAEPGLPGDVQGELQIVADESTNSLLVRATPADWNTIRQAIDLLDLRPLQVLIEVLIAEVSRNRELEVGLTGRGASATTRRSPLDATFGAVSDSAGTRAGQLVLRVMKIGGLDIDATLTALASGGHARILSRPIILAQNNLEAKILVGSQRPFVQVARALPTGTSVRDQVVQYRDVGTSLTLTPTINPDGYVSIQLTQEVSNVTGEVSFDAPVISNREASTHLFVRDGQTVVIGGLMDWQQDRSRSGVPGLHDIPVLGALFGNTSHSNRSNELFLFVTPHIVTSDEDAERLRGEIETRTDVLPDADSTRALIPSTSGGPGPVTPAPAAPQPPAPAAAQKPPAPAARP